MSVDPDVLIVGAGPVGMTVASLLSAYGVSVLVVERRAGTSDDPKAISLDDESLRTYQLAGIADEVMKVIVPGTGTVYYDSNNVELFHGRAAVPLRMGYPFKNPFAQPDLEKTLRYALDRNKRVELWFDAEFIDLDQDDTGVTARVDVQGRVRDVRASFVLGADGGRSSVRTALGISMTGRSHDETWLVIDTTGDIRTERYGMHHGDPGRPHVIVPGLHGRCRYEFALEAGECEAGEAPSFELIQRLLSPYRTIDASQIERAVAYKFHGLSADRWRHGRVFLLGDAAHMMPPFAGQGLNSGIRDAVNLAWKIATAVRMPVGENFLASYERERKPNAEAVIRSSERLGRVVMTHNRRLAAFRDRTLRAALSTNDGRAFFEEMRWRPVAVYRDGLVVPSAVHPLTGAQIGQPLVFWFEEHRQVLLDELLLDGWSVVGVNVAPDQWAIVRRTFAFLAPALVAVPLDDTVRDAPEDVRTAIDLDTRLYAELESARGCFVLLRPDRYVAAVAQTSELAAVANIVRAWFEPSPALVTS
jgi:3-(3-hydroxy-phenyl)propionate hydroxylase